jgi:hypothetical protein
MIPPVERVGPLGEPLLGKRPIFSCPALRQPLELPAFWIGVANHDQGHTLSWCERQRLFRLEQTFFVTGFNNSHHFIVAWGYRRPATVPTDCPES